MSTNAAIIRLTRSKSLTNDSAEKLVSQFLNEEEVSDIQLRQLERVQAALRGISFDTQPTQSVKDQDMQ